MFSGQTVSLGRIGSPYIDHNVFAQSDIHYGSRKRMKPTAIESHVQSFICHHDRKHRSISGANWSDPTVSWARPEQMKRISSGEKTCDNYDYRQRSLPLSRKYQHSTPYRLLWI